MKKISLLIILLLCVSLIISGCKKKGKENMEDMLGIDFNITGNEAKLDKYKTENPLVALYIKDYGAVVIELYKDIAPNTVNNMISLVKKGFYDKNTFHRLVPGFVLQGGDPDGIGTGGPGYSIKGEFENNGFKNDLKHTKGIVSMARSGNSNDSGGSQFFIVLDDAEFLDKNYAAFGKVIDGMETISRIENYEVVSNQESGKLKENLIIEKAIFDLKGNEYKEVEKVTE